MHNIPGVWLADIPEDILLHAGDIKDIMRI